jgi:hypothetical protein
MFINRYIAYIVLGLAVVVGGGSIIGLMTMDSLKLVNMGLDESGRLWFDAGLCLLFFVQHSGMARRSFRQGLARFIPEEYGGAFYTIASGLALLIVIVFWQQSAQTMIAVHGGWRWLFSAISLLALAGFVWGFRALRGADPLGLRPIVARLQSKKSRQIPFMVRGALSLGTPPALSFRDSTHLV